MVVSGKEGGEALIARINMLLQQAVSEGNYKEIGRLAKVAEELAALEDQEKQIAERRRSVAALVHEGITISRQEARIEDQSPRERGNRVRNRYVESLAQDGIQLQRLAAKKYRTPRGLTVGITYAKELEIRSDSWFLGLADEPFDIVILLCDSFYEETAAFILPPAFVKQIWPTLSRSEGQVKFHVTRAGTAYNLRLPGRDLRAINQYLNAAKVLQ